MIQLIAHDIIISITCMLWGIPVLLIQLKNTGGTNFWFRSSIGLLSFLFFSGLLILSFISSWLYLFIPLKYSYLLLLTVGLLMYLFFIRKKIETRIRLRPLNIKFSSIDLVFLFICLTIFLIVGCLNPSNNDTHVYHVQIIRWYNEYGAVPGIANLFPRFGLGSNWFNLISFFHLPFLNNQNFTYLNNTAVIWFFIWLLSHWKFHNINSNTNAANKILSHFYFLIILFCLFEWELFRDAASSTNYDFIVTALTIAAVSFLIEYIVSPSETKTPSFLFIILCISIIPFKLSGIFIILLILFYLFSIRKRTYLVFTFLASLIIVVPLLIKNYIVTGHLLYPLSDSFFSPDWQVPVAITEYLRQYIQVGNRFYNSNNLDFTQIPELMDKNWIGYWFNGILIQQKIIILASISSFFILFTKTKLAIDYKKIRLLFLLMLIMAAGWFFTVPSPRFGYGIILPLAFFPICFFIGQWITTKIHEPIIILTIFISCYYLYKKATPLINNPKYFIHTVSLDQPRLKKIDIKGIEFNLPDYINNGWMRDCYNTDIPCIYQENKYLQPRGASLKDGFKMEPKPDSIFIRNYVY